MDRKKSSRPIKSLEEVLLPFHIAFPITIELSVNKNFWKYPANTMVKLSYAEYENLAHSAYAKYLGH